ncbi:hypothetical protein TNCV_2256761 [Trichonephila clavipes]|nr:hypothetical protein TNCV_2256761 [Trichonephila clavipes]
MSETGKAKPRTGQPGMKFLGRQGPTLGCCAIAEGEHDFNNLHKILWVAVSFAVGLRVEGRRILQIVCLQEVVSENQIDKSKCPYERDSFSYSLVSCCRGTQRTHTFRKLKRSCIMLYAKPREHSIAVPMLTIVTVRSPESIISLVAQLILSKSKLDGFFDLHQQFWNGFAKISLPNCSLLYAINTSLHQCRFKLILGPGCRRSTGPLRTGRSKFTTRKSS